MHEECLICGAPLVYLTQDEEMECALCHRRERSKTRCQKGHYVCNTCHTRGLDQLVALCRREESRNPWTILEHLMAQPFCHMHGPEHHTMVGAALLTAYHNAGGALDLEAGPAGNAPPGQPGAWRRLRLLGGLRGRDQRGDVCLHRYRRHPLGRGALGPGQRDDVPGPGPDWSGGGTPLL